MWGIEYRAELDKEERAFILRSKSASRTSNFPAERWPGAMHSSLTFESRCYHIEKLKGRRQELQNTQASQLFHGEAGMSGILHHGRHSSPSNWNSTLSRTHVDLKQAPDPCRSQEIFLRSTKLVRIAMDIFIATCTFACVLLPQPAMATHLDKFMTKFLFLIAYSTNLMDTRIVLIVPDHRKHFLKIINSRSATVTQLDRSGRTAWSVANTDRASQPV